MKYKRFNVLKSMDWHERFLLFLASSNKIPLSQKQINLVLLMLR